MFFGLFHKTPERIVIEAEAVTLTQPVKLDPHTAAAISRAGLDLDTILALVQIFGPLMVALIERWLAKHAGINTI